MSPTLELTQQLLSRPSVSPEDHGCLDIIAARLQPLGSIAAADAVRPCREPLGACGRGAPVLCFAGHIDVVPPDRGRNGARIRSSR